MKNILLLLLFPIAMSAQNHQKYNWRRPAVAAGISFGSGAAWGLNQVLEHRNANFFRVFPNANRRFWGPDSWKNKYVGFDPENGRRKMPVWFTDGKHLTASIAQVGAFSAGVTIAIGEKRPFKHYVFDGLISLGAYSLGNFVVWDVIFKNK